MEGKDRINPRRHLRRAFALLASLLLYGCPYSSDEPLSDPSSAAIDPALLGAWRTRDAESGEWHRISFFRFDEHQMVVVAPGDEPGEVSASRVFVTVVGGQRFLNFLDLEGKDVPWHFARCTVEGDRCLLRFIDDHLFEGRAFRSADERRQFIRAHLDDPLLYAAEEEEPMEMILERASVRD